MRRHPRRMQRLGRLRQRAVMGMLLPRAQDRTMSRLWLIWRLPFELPTLCLSSDRWLRWRKSSCWVVSRRKNGRLSRRSRDTIQPWQSSGRRRRLGWVRWLRRRLGERSRWLKDMWYPAGSQRPWRTRTGRNRTPRDVMMTQPRGASQLWLQHCCRSRR